MYISTVFDDINIFPDGDPRENSAILHLPHFLKMPKGHEVALIGLTIWRTNRDYSIKKKIVRTQLLGSTLWSLDYILFKSRTKTYSIHITETI